MNVNELYFTKSHEWVKFLDETTALIGLSDYAQSELGDLVFVNLPEQDDILETGEVFGDVESVKAVSDMYSPVSGVVEEINEELLNVPEQINAAPYEAWILKAKDVTDHEALMTAAEYGEFINLSK